MRVKNNRICKIFVTSMAVCGLSFFAVCTAFAQNGGAIDTGNMSRSLSSSYLGGSSAEVYDIAFKNASLREVMNFLAAIADINVAMPETTEGTVNVSFRGVTVGDAINAIIKSNLLEYTLEGKVIRIGKGDQFKDSGEDLKTETFRLQYAPAREMESKIKQLLSSRGSVIFDERTNSVVVRELPANIDNVRRLITSVDIKDAQVLIESKIMEVTRNFTRALGLQWGMQKGSTASTLQLGGVKAVGVLDNNNNMNVNMNPVTTPSSGLLIGSFFKGTNLDFQILAAEKRGDVYVISDPSIVTSNGKSANIRSGATLLVQGSSTVNIGSTTSAAGTTGGSNVGSGLQEIETGVELKVTPQITAGDFVKLEIETTTSTPDFSRAVQGIPIIVDNTARTTVLVKDGETTVIGGLSRYSDNLTKQAVPGLSKIPLLGNLFKSKDRAKENSELVVFIKPTVIRTEGTLPAQMRVREVEERRENMYIQPIIKQDEEDTRKVADEKEAAKARKGNKYLR